VCLRKGRKIDKGAIEESSGRLWIYFSYASRHRRQGKDK
jgi:hypothetical protein